MEPRFPMFTGEISGSPGPESTNDARPGRMPAQISGLVA
jgi:hypothetical protein